MAQIEGVDVARLQQQIESERSTAKELLRYLKVRGVRPSSVYNDNRHFPFYYYLGQQLKPKKVLQIGPYLGVPAGCFMQSCKTVEEWWVISEKNSFTDNNIRLFCKGSANVVTWDLERLEKYKADVTMISEFFDEERYLFYLRYLWDCLKIDGYLVADFISTSGAFRDFCRMVSKTPCAFGTRYSVGILRK